MNAYRSLSLLLSLATLVSASAHPEGEQKLAGGEARNERDHRNANETKFAPKAAVETHGPLRALVDLASRGDFLALSRLEWLRALVPADWPRAFAALQTLPERSDKQVHLGALLRVWAERDPAAAASAANSIASLTARKQAQYETLQTFAARDAAGAAHWVGSAPGLATAERVQWAGVLAGTLAEKDATAAERFATAVPDAAAGDAAMGEVAAHRLKTAAPDALAAWVQAIPEGRGQAGAARAVAAKWAVRDPQATAAWLENLPGDRTRLAAGEVLAVEWTKQQPDAAAEWFAARPANGPWPALLGVAVREQTAAAYAGQSTHPEKVDRLVTWLRTLKSPAHTQAGLTAVLEAAGTRETTFALGNLDLLADPTARERVTKIVTDFKAAGGACMCCTPLPQKSPTRKQ